MVSGTCQAIHDDIAGRAFVCLRKRKEVTQGYSASQRQKDLGFSADELFSPHQLRHAFASTLTERGVDLLTLKELLGHVEVSTTFLYTTPSSDYLEKRVRLAQEKWRKLLLEGKE